MSEHASEGQIQDGFAAWLRARNIPFIMPRRDKRSTIKKGAHDCTAFMPGGKVLCIEMKTAKGKRSKEQEEWAAAMAAAGHHIHLCRSVEECVEQATKHPQLRHENQNDHRCIGEHVLFGNGLFLLTKAGEMKSLRAAVQGDEKLYRRL